MNPFSHESKTESPESGLRIGLAADTGDLLELDGGADFTEDLSNEVTAELNPAPPWINARPSRAIEPIQLNAEQKPGAAEVVIRAGCVLRDRYVLEQQLANGGTAMIFRAVDLRRDATAVDGRHVAVKVLRPELRDRPQSIARLQREFRQTQALAHPGIVRFHDLDCDRGAWFIVMELLTGESLRQWMRRASQGIVPRSDALRAALEVADALAFAHEHGVIHGDVKPDNIFMTSSGPVRLLDFGVAPESSVGFPPADPALELPVAAAATRVYASPEVLAGQDPEPRDDVFSLSCVVYEMLAGRHPYGRRGADVAMDANQPVEPLAGLTPAQWAALAAGLSWHRAERPGLQQLIEALGDERGPVASQVPAPVPPPRQLAVIPVVVSPPAARRGMSWRALFGWRSAAVAALALAVGLLIGRFGAELPPAPAFEATNEAGAPVTPPVSVPAPAIIAADERAAATAEDLPPPAAVADLPSLGQPGFVSFDSGSMVVSGHAVVAAIPVRHFARERRSVEIGWRVVDGSAIAGRDYGGPKSGVAKFTEGHTFRIIFVPILSTVRATADRTFTVELTDASRGAGIGPAQRIRVTIQGDV